MNLDSKVRTHAVTNGPGGGARPRGAGSFMLYAVISALALAGVLPAAARQKASTAPAQGRSVADSNGGAPRAEKPSGTASFRQFLVRARQLKDQRKLDLSRPREIVVEADRAEDGTLTNPTFTGEAAANPNFRRLAEDFVETINRGRTLKPLQDVSRVRMAFTLDGARFRVNTASETPSETRAAEMARGYRAMVNFARLARRGTDTALVLNNMKISSSGKQLLMTLDMPREEMGNILLRQITPN